MDIEELEGVDSTAGEESLAQDGDALGAALDEAIRGGREKEEEATQPEAKGEEPEPKEKPLEADPKAEPAGKETQPADAAGSENREYRTDHWPAQYRTALEKAPPELQTVWRDQVRNIETKWRQAEDDRHRWRGFAEPIAKLITPERQRQLQAQGLSPAQGLQNLVELNDFYTRDPKAYVKHVMDVAGLQPGDVWDGATQGQSEEWQDPETQQLRQEINDLRQQLGKQQYDRDYQEGLTREQGVQRIRGLTQTWAQATNDDGTPAYPYLDRVKPHMDHLLRHHPTIRQMPEGTSEQVFLKLHEAYNQAVYLDPEIREGEVMTQAERIRQEEDAKREAERAKRAKGLRSPGTGDGSSARDGGLDEILRGEFEAHRAAL